MNETLFSLFTYHYTEMTKHCQVKSYLSYNHFKYYNVNITTIVRYNIPNNNTAVAISSIHIFIITSRLGFQSFFDRISKKIYRMTNSSHHFINSHYAAFSKTIFAFLRTPLLAIRFRNLLFVLPQQAANFLPNLFSFFIFFFKK